MLIEAYTRFIELTPLPLVVSNWLYDGRRKPEKNHSRILDNKSKTFSSSPFKKWEVNEKLKKKSRMKYLQNWLCIAIKKILHMYNIA